MTRRRFLGGAAAAGAGLLLLRAPGALAAPPISPRLAYGPDARRTMRLAWSTADAPADLRAEVGLDSSFGHVLPVETRTAPGHDVRYHHALADGLAPGTSYAYRLSHTGGSVTGTFTTAPAAGDPTPFRFVAFGDQGAGADAGAVDALIAALEPALVFVVGDLSYASKTGGLTPSGVLPPTVDHTIWDAWLALAAGSGAASVPWLAGVGNHEIEDGQGELGYDGYLARVPLPGNGPSSVPTAWTARHGTVAFVNLDANDVSYEIARNRGWTGGSQTSWLEATLGALRADPTVDWIVVGYHHCSYCTNLVHASDGGPREVWEPLFDRYEVDLVVNGHNHCYERAHPIRGGAPTAEVQRDGTFDSSSGTTYLTAGGGGQAAYPTFADGLSYVTTVGGVRLPELAPWSAVRDPSNSCLSVDVVPPGDDGVTTMTVQALASGGAVLDRFVLRRTRAAAPGAAPAAPHAPDPAVAGGRLAATGGSSGPGLITAAAMVGAAAAARAVTR